MAIFDISLKGANLIFNAANALLIVGAVLVLVGTVAVVWSGSVREHFADQRISSNELETAQAKGDAAHANENAAKLSERAANLEKDVTEAKLEIASADSIAAEAKLKAAAANERAAKLEKEAEDARLEVARLTTPREEKFNRDAFRANVKGKPKIRVELLYQADDADSYMFESAIKYCLKAEGWVVLGPRPVKEDDIPPGNVGPDDKNVPLIFRMGSMAGGMSYAASNIATSGFDSPIQVLLSAITASRSGLGIKETSAGFIGSTDPRMPDDLVRLVIAPKYREW